MPMIAGRGLGHTGGTLDKLEAIPGFELPATSEQFKKNVEQYGFAMMGQTEDICPADKKLYALRDVTGTVESLPLICGSIMSKKLAEGLTGLVLDVKWGTGAFMKTEAEAQALAKLLKATGEKNGVEVHALITDMNQPLGAYVGNALEVYESVEILKGQTKIIKGIDLYDRSRELSLQLAGHMIYLAKKADSPEEGRDRAEALLKDGSAYRAFLKLCEFQGNARLEEMQMDQNPVEVISGQDGYVAEILTEKIGLAALELGAGRKKASDTIETTAGFEFNIQLGMPVSKGDVLFKIYGKDRARFSEVEKQVLGAIKISATAPSKSELIYKKLI